MDTKVIKPFSPTSLKVLKSKILKFSKFHDHDGDLNLVNTDIDAAFMI